MEKQFDEGTAINALVSVLSSVVSGAKSNPEFDEHGTVDISDGSSYQPIILLDEDEVANLIPFLEEQGAEERVINYLKGIQPAEQG